MRKVYQKESRFARLPVAVIAGAGITAVLFGFIPFAHRIAKPERSLELRSAAAVELPPPVEEQVEAPPTEMEKPPEAPPEPQLVDAPQNIPISADLEVAVGSGGVLAGFGEIRALTAAQTIQDETFDVSELEKRPEPVSQVAPAYPSELRKAKIEGLVTLMFVLNEDGRVEDPRVESSSRPEFEKPALEAVKRWRFRPGMKDGQPVRTYIKYPIRFRVSTG
jgi:protein TonB